MPELELVEMTVRHTARDTIDALAEMGRRSVAAVVVLGGLITSTVLNVFVMPAVCLWYGMRYGFPSERDVVEEDLTAGFPEVETAGARS